MTEAEWLAATDLTPMLEFAWGKASDRKWRLFAVACCQRVTHLLTDTLELRSIALAERFADNECSRPEVKATSKSLTSRIDPLRSSGWLAIRRA